MVDNKCLRLVKCLLLFIVLKKITFQFIEYDMLQSFVILIILTTLETKKNMKTFNKSTNWKQKQKKKNSKQYRKKKEKKKEEGKRIDFT